MCAPYVVAGDLGSGSCKTIILDAEGKVVAAAEQEYPTAYPRPGWVEQDPEDWYTAFCTTVRTVLEQSEISSDRIAALGIVGVTHNVVLLDDRDQPLCPTILIFDDRSTPQVNTILDRWGNEVWERTLNQVTSVWTWPQLLWIRENMPEVWLSTRRILFQKDYVRHRLAPSPVTDRIDAEGTLLLDPIQEEWIEPFCDDLGLQESWLPKLMDPLDVVSEVSVEGARQTGLTVGTPVIAGTTDTVAEVLGSGALRPGYAVVKLASVGRIAVVAKEPMRSPHILNYRHVLGDLWYPGTASKSAASSYRWARDTLWSQANGNDVYSQMDEAAMQVPPGCNGLIFHPHLLGEWAPHWDEEMRGNFIGLSARHTRGHLTRAVLEGVAFSLRDALADMEGSGLQTEEIRLIGQGSKSPLWSQIVANILDRRLGVPEEPDAAYGAALMTAMGAGLLERTATALEPVIAIREFIEPDLTVSGYYRTLFDTYCKADKALRPIYAQLHNFDQQYAEAQAARDSLR